MAVQPGVPLILFYNRFWREWPDTRDLGCADARFTTDRGRLADAHVVVFHVPTLGRDPLPPKAHGQQWAAWSMESAEYYPAMRDPAFLRQFEITMTYSRDSTIWFPYFGPLTAQAMLAPPRPKTASSPVSHFQSSPFNRSGRIEYAAALMRRVKVDSYGDVLRNRAIGDAGPSRAHGNVRGRDAMLELASRYKFTLAFENAVERDYVSDKFFDVLVAGSVPVYLGAPNIADFAPAPRSYIDASDFESPAALAAYLNHLDRHEAEYEEYLAWRRNGLSPVFMALARYMERHPFCRLADLIRGRHADPSAPGVVPDR